MRAARGFGYDVVMIVPGDIPGSQRIIGKACLRTFDLVQNHAEALRSAEIPGAPQRRDQRTTLAHHAGRSGNAKADALIVHGAKQRAPYLGSIESEQNVDNTKCVDTQHVHAAECGVSYDGITLDRLD